MGLFDSAGSLTVSGDYGAVDVGTSDDGSYGFTFEPAQIDLAPQGRLDFLPDLSVPDGASLIDERANANWFGFDQSKITASLEQVLASGTSALGKAGVQAASDAINRNATQPGTVGSIFRNFRSTETGAQINAAAYATQAQAWMANPMVWVAVIGGLFLILLMRK